MDPQLTGRVDRVVVAGPGPRHKREVGEVDYCWPLRCSVPFDDGLRVPLDGWHPTGSGALQMSPRSPLVAQYRASSSGTPRIASHNVAPSHASVGPSVVPVPGTGRCSDRLMASVERASHIWLSSPIPFHAMTRTGPHTQSAGEESVPMLGTAPCGVHAYSARTAAMSSTASVSVTLHPAVLRGLSLEVFGTVGVRGESHGPSRCVPASSPSSVRSAITPTKRSKSAGGAEISDAMLVVVPCLR